MVLATWEEIETSEENLSPNPITLDLRLVRAFLCPEADLGSTFSQQDTTPTLQSQSVRGIWRKQSCFTNNITLIFLRILGENNLLRNSLDEEDEPALP